MNWNQLAERMLAMSSGDLGVGATREEIEKAEQCLGVSLEGGYRAFLLRFGWGGVEDIELFGLGEGVPRYLHLERVTISERNDMRPWLPKFLIPIMNDGGGNLYCIDTSISSPEPPVVLWCHDKPGTQRPIQVANNFVDWLEATLNERSKN